MSFFFSEDIAVNIHEMAFPKKEMSSVKEHQSCPSFFFWSKDIAVNIQKMPFQERKTISMISVLFSAR